MGWSENRPHLFWYDVVIKFLCTYFLATIEKGACAGIATAEAAMHQSNSPSDFKQIGSKFYGLQ